MAQKPQRDGGGRRGSGVAIAVSIAAHVLALALLAWTTPALRLPTTTFAPDVTIDLVRSLPPTPRTPALVATPRAAALAPAVAATQSARRAAPPPAAPPPPLPPAPSRLIRPAPPSPAPATAPSPAPPGPSPRPSPSPGPAAAPAALTGPGGGDVHGAVRAAIGCSHEEFLRLNAAERAACERKMAQTPPVGAYVDPIPPLKRGAYDRQAAADARRRDHEGPMRDMFVPCEGVGSNFGIGCLPPDAKHRALLGAGARPPPPDPQP